MGFGILIAQRVGNSGGKQIDAWWRQPCSTILPLNIGGFFSKHAFYAKTLGASSYVGPASPVEKHEGVDPLILQNRFSKEARDSRHDPVARIFFQRMCALAPDDEFPGPSRTAPDSNVVAVWASLRLDAHLEFFSKAHSVVLASPGADELSVLNDALGAKPFEDCVVEAPLHLHGGRRRSPYGLNGGFEGDGVIFRFDPELAEYLWGFFRKRGKKSFYA